MERAAIYCRVSTDEEIQINALESQIAEAKQSIREKGWLLAGEYVDEGKSGTTTKHRSAYNRLAADMEKDFFDILVVKSQDRLMRNTKEWYVFVDRMVQSGKKLYFYLDNRFYTPDDALITGIKAILAEEYSRDLSKKINNAHRNRQKSGRTVLLTSNTWGYDKVGKEVVINEQEAEIVRLIYRLCIQGYGSRSISKELQNRGIRSRSGGRFQETTVRRIIRNPLFKGTAVMNKRHIDFNTGQTLHMPEEKWIVHEHAIPAIIDEKTWQEANDIMDKRLRELKMAGTGICKKGFYSGKNGLSGKIICGECGSVYWKRSRKNSKGESVIDWSCSEYVCRGRRNRTTSRGKKKEKLKSEGGCDNIHLKDSILMDTFYKIAEGICACRKEELIGYAVKILEDAVSGNGEEELHVLEQKKEKIMEKREKLLDKALEGLISDELFHRKDWSLESEYRKVQAKLLSAGECQKKKEGRAERLQKLQKEAADIFDKELSVKQLMEHIVKIMVYPEHVDVVFDLFENMRINIERKGYQTVMLSV